MSVKPKQNVAIRTVELFAGVGGFRHGLNAVSAPEEAPAYDVVWSNQFEPGRKKQIAAEVYRARWGTTSVVNRDLFQVLDDESEMARIDELAPEMLVGGFPCQDYSVARTKNAAGLEGKKGVLWWCVTRFLQARIDAGSPIKYLLLENVDRLINSPSAHRGRDFAVMLASLQSLGYAVEWRVVNSADYGFAQRRKRVFIVAYHCSTQAYKDLETQVAHHGAQEWLTETGTIAAALPAAVKLNSKLATFSVPPDVLQAQQEFSARCHDNGKKLKTKFKAAGVCVGGIASTAELVPASIDDFTKYCGQKAKMVLGDVVCATTDIPESFYIADSSTPRWEYLKGSKSIARTSPDGFEYTFSEGQMSFPDALDRPSRTIITSEGGGGALRTRHVVRDATGRLRRLVPEELEQLTGLPRGFTDGCGLTASQRAFLTGNALVTGLVTAIASVIAERDAARPQKRIEKPTQAFPLHLMMAEQRITAMNAMALG